MQIVWENLDLGIEAFINWRKWFSKLLIPKILCVANEGMRKSVMALGDIFLRCFIENIWKRKSKQSKRNNPNTLEASAIENLIENSPNTQDDQIRECKLIYGRE